MMSLCCFLGTSQTKKARAKLTTGSRDFWKLSQLPTTVSTRSSTEWSGEAGGEDKNIFNWKVKFISRMQRRVPEIALDMNIRRPSSSFTNSSRIRTASRSPHNRTDQIMFEAFTVLEKQFHMFYVVDYLVTVVCILSW